MNTRYAIALLLVTSACSEIPGDAYFNRGEPESLLDISSEVVNMNMHSATYGELSHLVAQDPPTRVIMNCRLDDTACTKAHHLFEQHRIPVETGSGPDGVTLIYERVVARDCENRYIDNSINPYNLHPPTFGCSVAANIVQMVSNKDQFTNPSLMDYPDAEKAVLNYRVYTQPPPPPTNDDDSSLIDDLDSN